MTGGHGDSAQCAWGLCCLGQAGLRTPFLLFVFHWVLLDLRSGKEDNEGAKSSLHPAPSLIGEGSSNLSLSSSQELHPGVCTEPDASLLLNCSFVSEGPSKASEALFSLKAPFACLRGLAYTRVIVLFSCHFSLEPGTVEENARDRVDVTMGAS